VEKLRFVGCAVLEKSPASQFFTLDQVVEIVGFDRLTVRRALEKLSREKIIIKIAKKALYQLESSAQIDLGKGRPPLAITYHIADKKGLINRIAPKLKENTSQDRMWSVIRNKNISDGCFTVAELITLAAVKRENARWFVKMLRRAGIIRPSKPGGPGVEWILVKDVGPRRPYVGAVTRRRQDAETRR